MGNIANAKAKTDPALLDSIPPPCLQRIVHHGAAAVVEAGYGGKYGVWEDGPAVRFGKLDTDTAPNMAYYGKVRKIFRRRVDDDPALLADLAR
jgi:hypothetical protein